eukprot:CAMPEP_0181420430 /NCGR_PEP_ID=MMETSP1110-20121109/12581_1 /TAXON_ID=174948 /ORGANISM="Symbiodinium sp., Strain CCMP421" /LENGTH=164 /DNA_ID=CAMNT_0023543469 /DNA_START=53 /DNA_END=543 /DNA_ORIENTATION=-
MSMTAVETEKTEAEEEWETLSQLNTRLGEQKVELRKRQQEEDAAKLLLAKKKLAASQIQGRKELPKVFRRPCAAPQELGQFRRLPVQYLEAKEASMMDRPDRCKWYSSKEHPAFMIAGKVSRTFDDPITVKWAKQRDPNSKVDVRQFVGLKHPPKEQPKPAGPA